MSNRSGGPKLPSSEAEVVAALGKAMYGDRLQSELASDIGEGPRVVRFWLAGERPRPRSP